MAGMTRRPKQSLFRGVSWHQGVWEARIRSPTGRGGQGPVIRLGRFQDEQEAARAYDKAARLLHGEDAKPNFPLPTAG